MADAREAEEVLAPMLARVLARGDRNPDVEPGETAQLARWFDLLPSGWSLAAITRQRDAGDAAGQAWLRADPAFVRPDMTGARVMAIGELGLSRAEADALLAELRPLFGDAGFALSAPDPARWYLALPAGATLPAFSPPETVLGDDLFLHLPEGPEGRRWRALLNEAQVLLHHHPVNAARIAAGRLPDRVRGKVAKVASDDATLASLAALATETAGEGTLLDLRAVRDWMPVETRVLESLASAGGGTVQLDFADGAAWTLRAGQRWRLWRRPLAALA